MNAVGLVVGLVVGTSLAARAATLAVGTTLDDAALTACVDAPPGAPADCSLRGAILNANGRPATESTTIRVPAGTYTLTQGAACVFRTTQFGNNAPLEIRGVTLTCGQRRPKGALYGAGGGANNAGALTVIDSAILESTTDQNGAGIYNSGTLNVVPSQIVNYLEENSGSHWAERLNQCAR